MGKTAFLLLLIRFIVKNFGLLSWASRTSKIWNIKLQKRSRVHCQSTRLACLNSRASFAVLLKMSRKLDCSSQLKSRSLTYPNLDFPLQESSRGQVYESRVAVSYNREEACKHTISCLVYRSLGLSLLECALGKYPYDASAGPLVLMMQARSSNIYLLNLRFT